MSKHTQGPPKPKPMERDEMFERVRGYVAIKNSSFNGDSGVAGFLALMHPEKTPAQIKEIVRAMRGGK